MTDSERTGASADAEMSDEQLQEFIKEANVMLDAQAELQGGMADLFEAPFDAKVQKRLADYLRSDQLQRATRAAHRLVEGGEE